MRIATIDIGTNSVLLLVVDSSPSLVPIVENSQITRLGQDVDKTRSLHPQAVERTLRCLEQYASSIENLNVDKLEVVSTSAARDAEGVDDFLRKAGLILGMVPRVISGEEEARLTFLGALSGLSVSGAVGVFDVGGGSTEIVEGQANLGVGEIQRAVSLNVGSVRLTERHVRSDPPSSSDLQAVAQEVRRELGALTQPNPGTTWIGIAGTVTTLAAANQALSVYDPLRIHGSTLTLSQLETLLHTLSGATLDERRNIPGIEPKRADVIVAGGLIVRELMMWAQADKLIVSDRGVRWGLALRAASPRSSRS